MPLFDSYRNSIIIKDHFRAKNIIVGDYSYYSGYYHGHNFEDCVLYLDAMDDAAKVDRLIVGKFCSFASGLKFMMGGTQGHNYAWISSYPLDAFDPDFDNYQSVPPKAQQSKGDTVVGNDVWIGVEAMIMPGIQIGDGAVIGTRALVTKNVGPYEIWGGNPARLIKKRFSDAEIEKLLQIQWWNWDVPTLQRNLELMRSNAVDALWEKFQQGTL